MTATESRADAAPALELRSANRFSIDELTDAYNQTRVDYMVPMPMNAARLAEYVHAYDVDMARSAVALADDQIVGLAMLGLRPGRSWITRLGVLPVKRRRGAGRALVTAFLQASDGLGVPLMKLEVIKNNMPAYNLFIAAGFEPTRELLILRRPPGPPAHPPLGEAAWLGREPALALLAERVDSPSWIMETESLEHVEHAHGLIVRLPDGASGWLVFEEERFRQFPKLLSHLVLHTRHGEPAAVGRQLLAFLYQRFPSLDSHLENVALDDPHLSALMAAGFLESFRRIEMRRPRPA